MQTASLTPGMKNALASLGNLQTQIEKTNSRLATGKRVNSALDNALNYFVANSFSSRARGLGSILDNIGLGINVLKQTDTALNSIRTSLEQAEGTLRAALNSSGSNPRAVTNFSFRNSLTGAADANIALAEAASGTTRNRFQVGDEITVNLISVDSTGALADIIGTGTTLTIGATTTVQSLLDNINNNTTFAPSSGKQKLSAFLNDAGNIIIESRVSGTDTTGNVYALQVVVNTAGGTGVQENTLDIFSFSGAIGGAPTISGTTTQTVTMLGGSTLQSTRLMAANTFREVLNQVRNTTLDADYNGTNLLRGDFMRIAFNDEETTSLVTRGQRVDPTSLGFEFDNRFATTGDAILDFQSDSEINDALAKIRAAKKTVEGIQAGFAANSNILTNRQDYTKTSIRNLTDGSDLLTLADINEEGATLSSLQTRQQLAVTSLALANQADQAILRLF